MTVVLVMSWDLSFSGGWGTHARTHDQTASFSDISCHLVARPKTRFPLITNNLRKKRPKSLDFEKAKAAELLGIQRLSLVAGVGFEPTTFRL